MTFEEGNKELDDIIEKAKDFKPNEYHSNTENFIKKLKEKIG